MHARKGSFPLSSGSAAHREKEGSVQVENLNDGFAREKMNAAPFISCLDKKKS
ncbi:hypothetical protein NBRC111894_185 [Sporolactobacillus inulinus]|uniref:Uncharacterized protein n=1 Tax=Sporolactobacillus inulinus TaxID=2078 RepID=A0A4Y1Z6V8_9BACL|nr:hypothetical protein NBRC111894_185 [Sporolactobacillus inulinus]